MYIGKTPTVGNFQKCDALTASATADYTLQVGSSNVSPESVNHMIVSLNGVIQAPTTAYTVSGATLSFTSALTSNDTIDFVILLGNVLDIGTPSDGTISNAKLGTDVISGETDIGGAIADADLFLLDDGAGGTLRKTAASRLKTYAGFDVSTITGATELAAIPADTDELLISDAGTLKRVDYSYLKPTNTPHFHVTNYNTAQTISTATATVLQLGSVTTDTASGWDTTNYKYVVQTGDGGTWFIHWYVGFSNPNTTGNRHFICRINGGTRKHNVHYTGVLDLWQGSFINALSDGDEIDFRIEQTSGVDLVTFPVTAANLFVEGFRLIT